MKNNYKGQRVGPVDQLVGPAVAWKNLKKKRSSSVEGGDRRGNNNICVGGRGPKSRKPRKSKGPLIKWFFSSSIILIISVAIIIPLTKIITNRFLKEPRRAKWPLFDLIINFGEVGEFWNLSPGNPLVFFAEAKVLVAAVKEEKVSKAEEGETTESEGVVSSLQNVVSQTDEEKAKKRAGEALAKLPEGLETSTMEKEPIRADLRYYSIQMIRLMFTNTGEGGQTWVTWAARCAAEGKFLCPLNRYCETPQGDSSDSEAGGKILKKDFPKLRDPKKPANDGGLNREVWAPIGDEKDRYVKLVGPQGSTPDDVCATEKFSEQALVTAARCCAWQPSIVDREWASGNKKWAHASETAQICGAENQDVKASATTTKLASSSSSAIAGPASVSATGPTTIVEGTAGPPTGGAAVEPSSGPLAGSGPNDDIIRGPVEEEKELNKAPRNSVSSSLVQEEELIRSGDPKKQRRRLGNSDNKVKKKSLLQEEEPEDVENNKRTNKATKTQEKTGELLKNDDEDDHDEEKGGDVDEVGGCSEDFGQVRTPLECTPFTTGCCRRSVMWYMLGREEGHVKVSDCREECRHTKNCRYTTFKKATKSECILWDKCPHLLDFPQNSKEYKRWGRLSQITTPTKTTSPIAIQTTTSTTMNMRSLGRSSSFTTTTTTLVLQKKRTSLTATTTTTTKKKLKKVHETTQLQQKRAVSVTRTLASSSTTKSSSTRSSSTTFTATTTTSYDDLSKDDAEELDREGLFTIVKKTMVQQNDDGSTTDESSEINQNENAGGVGMRGKMKTGSMFRTVPKEDLVPPVREAEEELPDEKGTVQDLRGQGTSSSGSGSSSPRSATPQLLPEGGSSTQLGGASAVAEEGPESESSPGSSPAASGPGAGGPLLSIREEKEEESGPSASSRSEEEGAAG